MNRAVLGVFGFSIPYALNANNKTEAKERILDCSLYMTIAYGSPALLLPLINKTVLRRAGIIKNFKDKGVEIVRVSKGYLTENAPKMIKGIKEKGEELGLEKEFNEILANFKGKEETLRKTLIKCHKNIAAADFIFTNCGIASIPWIVNEFTERTTGRKGYSGEFKMADKNYTDKQSEKHEKNKWKKMALSYALAITPSIVLPGVLAKAMLKNPAKLKGVSKWLNKNAQNFDYKDGKYMSMLTFAAMWITGEFPTYLLACRNKHELKYKSVAFPILGSFFFVGDRLLNNIFGRTIDRFKKTQIMNNKEYKNAGFWKKLWMPMKSLNDIKKLPGDLGVKSLKYATGTYWGNLAINAALLGVLLPKILNKVLHNDVKAETSPKNSFFNLSETLRLYTTKTHSQPAHKLYEK
ncbi:MAG: hypothetical protein A2Y25_01150 [Candidatus Melainabacteria bacterium GWF2_37_15]|nr:MAG: hypothetical protein A2Y25_01150 [Candidatus Melainabacteria bacterium GWF2_37_15]